MKLYNYLSRKKKVFKPLHDAVVGLYTCGPTVYDAVHIGNLRTYVFEDILKRALERNGFRVRHVMNITDVEDKIIARANERGISINELTRPHEKSFYRDLKALDITPAWKYPRATEHISEMTRLIGQLLRKKLAYEKDGSVYFDISSFRRYGALSRVKKRALKTGARVDADEYAKDAAQDFVLWKAAKPNEPSWPSPWGAGRPGWHIECSAMSAKYLGQPFDIHAGGVDLLFPHHENEIAQSEGAAGKPLAHFFVEGEHLMVDGKKMSKSLGNFLTLADIEARGYSPLAFRYFALGAHYRSTLNFTWDALESAAQAVKRLGERAMVLAQIPKKKDSVLFRKAFKAAVDGDLNMPSAAAAVWKHLNALSLADLLWADEILGLNLSSLAKIKIPSEIKKLAAAREKTRASKNWASADETRRKLQKLGWAVDDTADGPILKRL